MRSGSVPAIAIGLATVALVLGAVELLLYAGVLNRFVIPFLSVVLCSFGRLFAEEHLIGRLVMTGAEALAASVLVTLLGVSIGVLLYKWRILRLATESWVAAAAAAPIVLAYPLFLVMLGRSAATIVTMAVVSGLPPVILQTVEGLNGGKRSLVNVGRSYSLSSSQIFLKILFPA